jgi:phosphoglycolate phosphatase-like HAD superfamily hydrolase
MAGLASFFEMGAFGNEAVDRPDLVPLAFARALDTYGVSLNPRSIIIIGDTPRDVACGRAFGATTVSVATGPFPLEILGQCSPDLLLSDLADAALFLEFLGDKGALQGEAPPPPLQEK